MKLDGTVPITDEPRFPAVARWLDGSKPTHPLRALINGEPDLSWVQIGNIYEELLSYLDELNPLRIDRKRAAFANDIDGSIELRTELVTGYNLGKGGVTFEFGGEGQPDYICTTPRARPAFVEVTTRTLDGLYTLQSELDASVADLDVAVVLTSSPLLRIPEHVRRAVRRRVVEAAVALAAGEAVEIDLPEISGQVHLTKGTAFPPDHSHIGLNTSPELTQHMADVTDQVTYKLLEKAEQAVRNGWSPSNTVVLVDASRLGRAWLSAPEIWAARLGQFGLPWSELPFAGVGVVFSTLTGLALTGGALLRPNLATADKAVADEILAALGFTPAPG